MKKLTLEREMRLKALEGLLGKNLSNAEIQQVIQALIKEALTK